MPKHEQNLSEAEVQLVVTDTLSACGWMWVHFRAARTKHGGWVTPYEGDDYFIDIVALKDGRQLALEIKSSQGAKKPGANVRGSRLQARIRWEGQQAWLDEFDLAGAFTMFVTPDTLDMALKEIER